MKKIVALFLSIFIAATCCMGCGTNGGSKKGTVDLKEGQTEIVIAYWNLGTGIDWLEETVKAFETKYPEYKVTVNASSSSDAVKSALGMDDIDKTDIYMANLALADTELCVSLNDVLDTVVDGEKVAIKDKFNEAILDSLTDSDGNVKSLYFGGGVVSLVYNTTLFEKAGITQLPRTTDELSIVCDQLYDKDIVPLCHFTDGGYYGYVSQYYQAQYDGVDYYINNFYADKDENGTSPSESILLKKDGRYYALEAFEKFITPEYTLSGSNTKSHTEVQTEFVNDKAAMMFNGSWLRNELATVGGTEKIAMMRMPILSSIINRLSTVSNDYVLRDLITAIDQVLDGEKQATDFASGEKYIVNGTEISADDWNKVIEARGMVYQNYVEHGVYVPTYSDNIEGAKKFIEFMHSDEGLTIYHNVNKLPKAIRLSTGEEFDLTGMTEFEKTQFQLSKSATALVNKRSARTHRIFVDGGASSYAGVDFVTPLCTNNSSSRKNAKQLWETVTKTIDEQYDKNWLPNIK